MIRIENWKSKLIGFIQQERFSKVFIYRKMIGNIQAIFLNKRQLDFPISCKWLQLALSSATGAPNPFDDTSLHLYTSSPELIFELIPSRYTSLLNNCYPFTFYFVLCHQVIYYWDKEIIGLTLYCYDILTFFIYNL